MLINYHVNRLLGWSDYGKKELIRKTAIKVIASYRYHNTKVQRIADEAGIANGTVYHYFKSKQDILEYIYYVEIEKRIEYLDELEKRDGSILEKLELYMNYLFREYDDNFDLLKVLTHDGIFQVNYGPNTAKMLDEMVNRLAKLIEEGCNSGELKEVNAKSFASIILDFLRGAMYESKFLGNMDDYKEKKSQIINFVLDGIRKR